ncbi:MAG TPA: PSD1 and planctomycete cytochrome C domain-containing protein [Gemmataceae bacterium]|nr:PSD1 and planctomycete cytochrome C domain-containing protein [Gemmataceae bacterium]
MRYHSLLFLATLLPSSVSPLRAAEKPPTPEQVQFFEKQVRPLLSAHCFKCHGPDKQRGDLRLDSRSGLMTGGQSGAVIVPGKPSESLLIDAINYRRLEMPPNKRLSGKDVATLTEWVRMGAPWPGPAVVVQPRKPGFSVTDEDRKYWAFQPVRRPPTPRVEGVTHPIDAFVLEKLSDRGLSLSPLADRRTLIRRAYFDLIGLPPAPEDVDAFLADRRPDAYERLVDRLLASPQYGERWGRHWLDVVRFGQTNGYERDDEKPHAWRYRDYVIRSFNDDKPYDRFVREQLAGDELDPITDDSLTATAFYRVGVWDDEPDDKRQADFDELDDMLSVTGSAFLGLTVGCARCHDHKFDPIGQEDYYSMLAFLRNIKPYVKAEDKGADRTIFARLKRGGLTLAVHESGPTAPPTHVLTRGSAATPGKAVEPRFVRVLCPSDEQAEPRLPSPPRTARTTGRRRVLADWVASKDNPLTARVLVNRLWQHHFGKGIVATPSDFGRTGLPPTHPELLDWLAAELVEGGWRLKHIHRLILTSQAYRQSSRVANSKAGLADPGNVLLWRQNLRRLEAEAIRDTVLAVSGRLNPAMGGRGVFPTLPPEVLATQSMPGRGWDKSSDEEQARRSVYIFVKRTLGVPLLDTFDFASPDTPTAARATTTIAPQALLLLNSTFMDQQSLALADRLLRGGERRPQAQVERLFRLAFTRRPTEKEETLALRYLEREQKGLGPGADGYRRALSRLCKVVLNLNELVYID